MNQGFRKISSLILVAFFSFLSPLMAEDEDFLGMRAGDLSFSVGAGKNIYFDDAFELVAPYMVPVSLNYAIFNKLEIGLDYSPVFFADRSNVNFENTNALKNHNFGGIQSFGGNLRYAVYNDYGVMAYLSGGGKYNILDKNEYKDDHLLETDADGYNITVGLGVKYQLGDDHGDLFPWFFNMGIYYSRIKYDISSFRRDEALQPQTESGWNDLNFNGLDVVISFGYRFRSKK